MTILCFHLLLIKVLVRIKKKGCMYTPLTFRDRVELVEKDGIKIALSHIHKVLNDSENALCSFNQHTMDALACYTGFADWNAFLKQYPLPEGAIAHTGQVTGKVRKKLEELIYEMLKKNMPGNGDEK